MYIELKIRLHTPRTHTTVRSNVHICYEKKITICVQQHAMPHQDNSLHSFLNFKLENSDFEIFAELERLHSAYAVRVRRFWSEIYDYVPLFGNSFNNFPAV